MIRVDWRGHEFVAPLYYLGTMIAIFTTLFLLGVFERIGLHSPLIDGHEREILDILRRLDQACRDHLMR